MGNKLRGGRGKKKWKKKDGVCFSSGDAGPGEDLDGHHRPR